MFSKVLVANRGAIACRIIRTLRRLGVASVAVYSEADSGSLHVRAADEAVLLGPGPAAESYLRGAAIIEVARLTGAQAIHPGYGFLAENAAFAEACAAADLIFIGPTPEQMQTFGLKHTARALAREKGVPLLPGSELVANVDAALLEAERIGYPVMIKSTAGGGGIGMRLAASAAELASSYEAVARLAQNNFTDAGIFLEKFVARARHIEVQIFGDGRGGVLALGERDCSVQRRNQKVLEETPAPGLTTAQRQDLVESAVRLLRAVDYRSAGTVEFVYDESIGSFYFLEVNTRLQVEHGVTEEVFGIDLVEWMVRLAADDLPPLAALAREPVGVAIQARLYAEDPAHQFRPSTGVLTDVRFAADARVETWIERGSTISGFYDPMLAKIIVRGADRAEARQRLQAALAETTLAGIETNLDYLRAVIDDPVYREGRQITGFLARFVYQPSTIDVLEAGVQTSVQDWPGRLGYWHVGVPPSGPMDAFAHRLANRLVGNAPDAAALECTLLGPTLAFRTEAIVAVTGAPCVLTLDDRPLAPGESHRIAAGSVLAMGVIGPEGSRAYLAVGGGLDVPLYLGSRATFTLGQFGGHGGRTLRAGDVLHLLKAGAGSVGQRVAKPALPRFSHQWDIAVLYGPHGAPDFFLDDDIATFFATDWEVHHNSSRTGVRLIGPKPVWARPDGGEAGLHPSNIHDNAYAIGAVDFTGDMPVVLGPDGPSLGGFVCPAVVAHAELWKLGQLRPGDRVRFHRQSAQQVARREQELEQCVADLVSPFPADPVDDALACPSPILAERAVTDTTPRLLVRQVGDRYLLVEYGPLVLDIELRLRVHALMSGLDARRPSGLLEMTPGIRSLQIHFDPGQLPREQLLAVLLEVEAWIPAIDDLVIPSRIVHLPLAWNDSQIQVAIQRYGVSVRPNAPWSPSNIEFMRRMNGLDSVQAVEAIFFDARYLVLGLGDVYLGAPVATPIDPRHRLVTTKYNPARTWTPENAVGIGGAYLCVYGLEGPGGYQLAGRTVQMWNRWRHGADAPAEFQEPWLLRFFDQLRFYPVTEEELTRMRIDFPQGRLALKIEETQFSLREYRSFLAREADSIARFKAIQQRAFEAERERWRLAGEEERALAEPDVGSMTDALAALVPVPEGQKAVHAPVQGSVWKVLVAPGDVVASGAILCVIESMKMEFPIAAASRGRIATLLAHEGMAVGVGQELLRIETEPVALQTLEQSTGGHEP